MIRARFACGFIAAGMVATAAACVPSAERATDKPPAVATAWKAPSETLSPLFETALPNVECKMLTSAIVDFPPAARAAAWLKG